MNLKLLLFAFTSTLFVYSLGNRNRISGQIFDSLGQPLFGATVVLDKNTKATVTDDDGFYVFNNLSQGTHVLKASFMGFLSKSIEIRFEANEVDQEVTQNFYLKENVEALQEVNIQSKTEKRRIEEKGFSVNSLIFFTILEEINCCTFSNCLKDFSVQIFLNIRNQISF